MDAWSARPDRGENPTQLQMMRCKPGHPLGGIVLGDEIVGAYTHYWKGRTSICLHPTCDACDALRAPRWYGYICVMAEVGKALALLELTPSCLPAIEDYLRDYGTLRGAKIVIARVNKKPNSRLQCTVTPGHFDKGVLPKSPDVKQHLCKIWELPALQQVIDQQHAHQPITNGRVRTMEPRRP